MNAIRSRAMGGGGFLRAGALALALALAPAARGDEGAPLRLGPEAARAFAAQLVAAGEVRAAREILRVLLARDPADATALLILARAEREDGRAAEAGRAARTAFRASDDDGLRFVAAMSAAGAAVDRGAPTFGQLWLRRAVQAAPDAATRAFAVNQFRALRAVNPLSVALRFGIAPTSNVNNGARGDTVVVLGLPFRLSGAAQALSGTEIAAGAALRYRLAATRGAVTEALFTLDSRDYVLSSEAKAQAPGVRGADFAFRALEVGLARRVQAGQGAPVDAVTLRAGRNWFGGVPLTDYLRGSLSRTLPLAERRQVAFEVGAEAQHRHDASARATDSIWLETRLDQRLAGGGGVGLRFGLRDSRAALGSVDHTAVAAGIRLAQGRPVAGLDLSASVDVEWRDYGAGPLSPTGREDWHADLSVTARLASVEMNGFSPTLTLQARGVFSQVAIYDTREIGIRLGVASNF